MFELLYTSISRNPMSDQDLIELLEQARERNEAQNITGMLIFNKREFVQLLEGSEIDVRDVFASIERDERHMSVSVFYSGAIQKRAFANWSMAFHLLDSSNKTLAGTAFEEFATGSPRHLLANNPNIGKDLFLTLKGEIS